MKNYDAKQALSIVINCAKSYENKLNNKHFLIIYQDANKVKNCCVGFREGKSADIPVTLYREDIKKLSHPTCKVLAIFCKEYNEEHYDLCTYLSKGYAIDKLPEDIKVKIEHSY